jgi:hypothetical protein
LTIDNCSRRRPALRRANTVRPCGRGCRRAVHKNQKITAIQGFLRYLKPVRIVISKKNKKISKNVQKKAHL